MSQLRVLAVLLRFGSVILVTAFFAILLPREWMAVTHEWLGLGEFPRAPIVDYLARSTAALYGFHGPLLFVLSRDPVRFQPILTFLGAIYIAFGLVMTAIDLHAPMPLWWMLAEGPGVVVLGIVILYLLRAR